MTMARTGHNILLILLLIAIGWTAVAQTPTATAPQRRRITPVNNASTATQPINENKNDTVRLNEQRRAHSTHFVNDKGEVIFIDTITGKQWRDSTEIKKPNARMKHPLLESVSVGVNIWDPIMRAFGQKYGIIDFCAELSLHNRYKPIFEVGLGTASNTPDGANFTYKSPTSIYFRIGANYNFLFNSTTDYQFYGGLRYGFAPFKFWLSDVSMSYPYWGEETTFDVPAQSVTAGWLEICLGLKIKLFGPISAGWTFKYRQVLHQTKTPIGEAWYIPGYGAKGSAISGAFTIYYTLPLHKRKALPIDADVEAGRASAGGDDAGGGAKDFKIPSVSGAASR